MKVEILDLRREVWIRREGVVVERRANPEDPRGYTRVNLKEQSHFFGFRGEGRYYGADYDSSVVNQHHSGAVQEYLLAGTAVRCDLFINLPKLKTHKKTGLTCSLKNLVGINGDKNWLPHHTKGNPRNGGDEFPDASLKTRLESSIKEIGKHLALLVPGLGTWLYRKVRNAGKRVLGDSDVVVRNGNWFGNDTCWRMALDLNRALLYANPDGSLRSQLEPKNCLTIIDGIVGGEGNGPLCPTPVQSRVLVAGANPAEVDAVAAVLMGFDPRKVPLIVGAFASHPRPIARKKMEEVIVWDGRVGNQVPLFAIEPAVEGGFRPHFAWADAITRKDQ